MIPLVRSQRWRSLYTWGVRLATVALAVIACLWWAAPVRVIPLPTESFLPGEGKLRYAPIKISPIFLYRHSSDAQNGDSPLQLFEDGKRLAQPHSQHDGIREKGQGRYSHWNELLYFSASDDTDPITNGRTYTAVVNYRIRGVLLWLILPLGSWLLLHLVWQLPGWVNVDAPAIEPARSNALASHLNWLLPLVAAALPSALLLALLPPLYTDVTISGIATSPASVMPHYPPAYAYLVYWLHLISNTLAGAPNSMSMVGVYTLVITQQLLLSGAIFYLALGCSRTLWGRLVAALPFYLLPVFALVNHGLQTEAVWSSCLIFMLGAAIRMVRQRTVTTASLVCLCIGFTTGLLIRPTTLFIMPAIPAVLFFILLAERSRAALMGLVVVLATLGISAGWGSVVNRVAAAAHGRVYYSPWGRGTIEVLQRLVWDLEDGKVGPIRTRDSLQADLIAAATNAPLRNAIPIIIKYLDAGYDGTGKSGNWGGAHYALQRLGTRDGDGHQLPLTVYDADQLVNEFCVLFMKVYPDLMFDSTVGSMQSYFWSAVDPLAHFRGHHTSLSASFHARDASMKWVQKESWPLVPTWMNLPMVRGSEKLEDADLQLGARISWMVLYLRSGYLVGLLFLATLAGWLIGRVANRDVYFVAAVFVTGLVAVTLNSILLCYIWRYQMTYEIPLACSLSLILTRLVTSRARTISENQASPVHDQPTVSTTRAA